MLSTSVWRADALLSPTAIQEVLTRADTRDSMSYRGRFDFFVEGWGLALAPVRASLGVWRRRRWCGAIASPI
jgi:hypothetical protein